MNKATSYIKRSYISALQFTAKKGLCRQPDEESCTIKVQFILQHINREQ